ncbi:MAG: hypothetical protein KC459_07855, partial [Ruminococcus sp.]|nr:hypothetical protein [Ruminococcus sp.]
CLLTDKPYNIARKIPHGKTESLLLLMGDFVVSKYLFSHKEKSPETIISRLSKRRRPDLNR